jgi:hypothetical protein
MGDQRSSLPQATKKRSARLTSLGQDLLAIVFRDLERLSLMEVKEEDRTVSQDDPRERIGKGGVDRRTIKFGM